MLRRYVYDNYRDETEKSAMLGVETMAPSLRTTWR